MTRKRPEKEKRKEKEKNTEEGKDIVRDFLPLNF